jgi:hypothetical protein
VRDPERIDRILAQIRTYWKTNPDIRLGQLICNISRDERGYIPASGKIFNIEDDEFEKWLRVVNEHLNGDPSQNTISVYVSTDEMEALSLFEEVHSSLKAFVTFDMKPKLVALREAIYNICKQKRA